MNCCFHTDMFFSFLSETEKKSHVYFFIYLPHLTYKLAARHLLKYTNVCVQC